jgi:N6-adenosine-specific RNA methylase IME4
LEISPKIMHIYGSGVPNGLAQEGLDVMKAWGFTYRNLLVWIKTNIGLGLGNYLRNGCEIALFGTRGRAPVKFKGQSNLLFAPRQDHSHKPEEFFAIVERLYDGPYLELFARRYPSSNKDWSVWGNEIESDIFIPGYPVPKYSANAILLKEGA